jgi:hypothetical protein
MLKWVFKALLLSIFTPSIASAQQVGSEASTYEDGILVTAEDVTTCPYHFIGPVYISSGEDFMTSGYNRAKVYEKLRNAAKKVAADAIVLVQRGGSHLSLWSWDRREYTGRAIRYVERSCAPKQ